MDLGRHYNWPPDRPPEGGWWQDLAAAVSGSGLTDAGTSWGIPFVFPKTARVILAGKDSARVRIPIGQKANYLCVLHRWRQIPETIRHEDPCEGLVVAEYTLDYGDGKQHVQPIRARFEVEMAESPGGPLWLAVPYAMPETVDAKAIRQDMVWGAVQTGLARTPGRGKLLPLLYALPNPEPGRTVRSLEIRALQDSPILFYALTLYQGAHHPLRHLPRRSYRVTNEGKPAVVEEAGVTLGVIARRELTDGARDEQWLSSDAVGTQAVPTPEERESLIDVVAAPDAELSVRLAGEEEPVSFSVGEAFYKGTSAAGAAAIEVLGRERQWLTVRIIDTSTGKPTPVRIHFSGAHGEYLAPYGHHTDINNNWFEDYGADVVVGGRNFAYVDGEFTTDVPVGDIYAELYKGFEYEPVRQKVTVKAGQKTLELTIKRWKDLRSEGWVTADTHVHFISPHSAWLEGQAEGVNVVNLLASQWGRLFTNVGDLTGRPGIVENDTIVFVGTENRHHMLGHMSMLGTQGLPVYPMCAGGPPEAWIGDPEVRMMTEWAAENRRKGGVIIRPHFPDCGHTEDPVPILKGLVDAVEIRGFRGSDFPAQEWYRYLNCGYRVAVCAGTDKMGAHTALGWLRTYAKLDPNRPFTYDTWAESVRAGRVYATTGPLMEFSVEGRGMGETVQLPASGGTLEVTAIAQSFWPLSRLEIVCNGKVAAVEKQELGAKLLRIQTKVPIRGSGWIAARCSGVDGHPAGYMAAHTSPVYVRCGESRAFDGPTAEHMLALVEGGIEHLETLATVFDESSRRRMVKLYQETRDELRGRLVAEAHYDHHAPQGHYHTHGHGAKPDHSH